MSDVIVISHSEVESFLTCQQKHYYAFGDSTYGDHVGLEPTRVSDALFRGNIGHQGLAVFFKAIQAGDDVPSASEKSLEAVRQMAMRPEILGYAKHLEIVMDLSARILPRFYKDEVVKQLDEGWFPAHVEETFRLKFAIDGRQFEYPFTPDAIMRDFAGNLWVWDHKFVYDFYQTDEVNLLPQIPKYTGALRANNIPIKGGYYNMLRWRPVKDYEKQFRSEKFVPTDERVKNAFHLQYRMMVEIARRKLMTDPEWVEENTRILNGMVCKHCSFKVLCAADLNGLNTDLMRRVEFKPNSYGYQAEVTGE